MFVVVVVVGLVVVVVGLVAVVVEGHDVDPVVLWWWAWKVGQKWYSGYFLVVYGKFIVKGVVVCDL